MSWFNPVSYARLFLAGQVPDQVPLAKSHLAVDNKGEIRLLILGTSAEDKAIWSAHLDKASHDISHMTDPWWIMARDFELKLEQRGKLVQAIKEHDAATVAQIQDCESRLLPQLDLPLPTWGRHLPSLQQALIGYQHDTICKLGQMKEALLDPAVKSSQAELANVRSDLAHQLEMAQQLTLTTQSQLANEQTCSLNLALALLEARASSEEQQALITDQLKVETGRADRVEALVDTKAMLLAAERALSFSLALEKSACEEKLKRQEENNAANIVQLGDEINFFTRELVLVQARHEAEAAVLRHTSSAQSQLLQAARDESDLTVSSLRKQLQQEADKNRAMNQAKQELERQMLGMQKQTGMERDRVECVEKELAQAKDFSDSELKRLRSENFAAKDSFKHIESECYSLKQETSKAVAARSAAVKAREVVERELRDQRQATSAQQDQVASLERQLQLGSASGGFDWGSPPGSHAAEPPTSTQAQTTRGPGSPDEASHASSSDHAGSHSSAPDEQEDDDEAEVEGVGDDAQGVMYNFLPADIPSRPTDTQLADSAVQVAQLASHQWHHRCLAVLEHYSIPWKGCWDLEPLSGAPGVFFLALESLPIVGRGTFGRVHFGQRWVGVGAPGSPQAGWTEGWEPVAIKITKNSHAAKQELACLQKLRCAMTQLPGHHHVIQLLDSHVNTYEPGGVSWVYTITRYEEGYDLDETLGWMKEKWSEEKGSAREEGHAQWLLGIKSATRQALQGLELIHSCGLVHGDIKPDNMRASLPPNGTQLRLAIIDLGGSCAAGSDWTHLQAAPAYTSPEGLDYFHNGKKYLIGSAADVFSMGCVLFELITGLFAFGREEDSSLGVPEWRQKTALRQAVWGRESAQGSTVPHGLEALRDSLPDREDCQQAEDLLQRMLQIEPSCRPTVQQALAHPFLQG